MTADPAPRPDADDDLLPSLDAAPPRRFSPVLAVAGLALAGLVGWGVWLFVQSPDKAPQTAPVASSSAQAPAPAPTVDAARIAALEAKAASDPQDVATLKELGDLYAADGNAAAAKDWHAKAVAVKPDDPDLLLALGIDLFSLEDYAGAITAWQRVTELRPADVEAWYNLGWAHLQADPPRFDEVERAWQKVVDLAPDSKLAQTVRSQLPGQATASPTASR